MNYVNYFFIKLLLNTAIYAIMKYGMSNTLRARDRLRDELGPDSTFGIDYYNEMYGPLAYKGMDIGSEVVRKAKSGDFVSIWSTLLARNGADNGITAGFLVSACGIHPNPNDDVNEGTLVHGHPLSEVIEGFNRVTEGRLSFELEVVHTKQELPEGLKDVPEKQGWSLPGVLVHYTPKTT